MPVVLPVTSQRWRKRVRRTLRLSIWVALTVGPLVVIGLWLLFHHRPGWYRPAPLSERTFARAGVVARAQVSLADVADRISDQMVRGEPFEVSLSIADVNDWITAATARPPARQLWPGLADGVPGSVSAIAVGIDGGSLRVGGLLRRNTRKWIDWQAIVSVELSVAVSADGGEIHVRIGDVRAGSLGVPDGVVLRMLGAWMDDEKVADLLAGVSKVALDELESLEDFFKPTSMPGKPGKPSKLVLPVVLPVAPPVRFANRFVWPNGERPFRIDALDVSEDAIRIRFHPLR